MKEDKTAQNAEEELKENSGGEMNTVQEDGYLSDNIRVLSPWRMVMKRFFRSKLSMVGLAIIIFLFLFSFLGPVCFTTWGEVEQDLSGSKPQPSVMPISFTDDEGNSYDGYIFTIVVYQQNKNDTDLTLTHPLGTDDLGMDIFTRLMYGGRISLSLSLIVVLLETLIGVVLGGLAGYFGKWIDSIIMRIVDMINCIPTLPIMLIISVALDGTGVDGKYKIYYMMVMLTVLGWAGVARIVRGQILMLREQEYMVAAEACGIPSGQQIFKHLIPNVMPQLIVAMTLGLGSVILYEATLGYLGLGVEYPSASWGTIIEAGANADVLRNGYWNMWIPAGICIVLAVLAFNFIGDGLRDALDPKMKR